jgi:hypothetical protein
MAADRHSAQFALAPFSFSNRFSTTVWVAIPAWSVPGIHETESPFIRRQRTMASFVIDIEKVFSRSKEHFAYLDAACQGVTEM